MSVNLFSSLIGSELSSLDLINVFDEDDCELIPSSPRSIFFFISQRRATAPVKDKLALYVSIYSLATHPTTH